MGGKKNCFWGPTLFPPREGGEKKAAVPNHLHGIRRRGRNRREKHAEAETRSPASFDRFVAGTVRYQVGRAHGAVRARGVLHDVFHARDAVAPGAGVAPELFARSTGAPAGTHSSEARLRRRDRPSLARRVGDLWNFPPGGTGRGLAGKSAVQFAGDQAKAPAAEEADGKGRAGERRNRQADFIRRNQRRRW